MKIIPSYAPDTLTQTEARVFELSKSTTWDDGAIVLSSLALDEHEYKRWCEIDFVALGAAGAIAIEVKGGSVRCADGVWSYDSIRTGLRVTRNESPYEQVSKAFFALEKALLKSDLLRGSTKIPGGFCVIFASVRRRDMASIVGRPGRPAEITGYAEDLESPSAFAAFLTRVSRHWADASERMNAKRWDATNIKSVAAYLRQDFERTVPLGLRIGSISRERIRYTDEQYSVLDHLESEPRLYIAGGAGCGKTFIAIESARREQADGQKVAFVTGTEGLATFLVAREMLPKTVTVLSRATLQNLTKVRGFDVVIVDEGQQITDADTIGFLHALITNGFENGRWRWFGDYGRQVALDSKVDSATHHYIRMLSAHQHLVHNCRNTPQIIKVAEALSGERLAKALVRGNGPDVVWKSAKNRSGIASHVANVLRKIVDADMETPSIAILCASDLALEDARSACNLARIDACNLSESFANTAARRQPRATVATINEFRGLEADYIILLGLDDVALDSDFRAQGYIATTRATYGATVVHLTSTDARITKLLLAGL